MLDWLLSDGGYSPHGFCLAWDPALLNLHIFSDVLIAVSYFSIPVVLATFLLRRRPEGLGATAWLAVAFITLCGVTHLVSVLTLFEPLYGLQGILKLLTGIVSAVTAIVLWRKLTAVLAMPSNRSLVGLFGAREGELLEAVADREDEIAEKERAESILRHHRYMLKEKVAELEISNAELKEFAYAASHDLKSPANTLQILIDDFEIEYGEELSEEAKEELADARELVNRMRSLVEDILHYSRVVNADTETRDEVDLNKTVKAVIADHKSALEEAGAVVEVGDLETISGYAPMLSMLLNNLVGNAIRYRSPDRPLRIVISTKLLLGEPRRVQITVRDNGIGIAPEHHERIFGMFKRLFSADQLQGSGLGLALCRRIAIMHGGSITVLSDTDSGAQFRVTLPVEVTDVETAA